MSRNYLAVPLLFGLSAPMAQADEGTQAKQTAQALPASQAPLPSSAPQGSPAPPAAQAERPETAEQQAPTQKFRQLTIAAGVGFNSLIPLGVLVGLNLTEQLTAELTWGVSLLSGQRIGARVRYSLIAFDVSPYIGLGTYWNPETTSYGLNFAPGGGGDRTTSHAGVFLAPILGAVAHGNSGFFAMAGAGCSIRLSGQSGEKNQEPLLEAAMGYSF